MILRTAVIALLFSANFSCALAQTFTRVLDSSNPIVTAPGPGPNNYPGAAWVDYDSDGDIDLFACPNQLFKNMGNGQFTEVANHGIGAGLQPLPATGVSWADMDNDGDMDCMYSGSASVLYRNNGKDSGCSFTAVKRGDISNINNRGWACAWGDVDNDGFVDLVVTHPRGFVGAAVKNQYYRNLGAGELLKITDGDVVKDLAPYTVATWYDYDLDGDQDMFIGSGPAGTPARDYIFKNLLKESGTPTLQRINEGIIGTDLVDGQVWNWIDYDNDGDLDAYLTNYGGVANNNLYRNDNGTYVKMTAENVGPIVASNNGSLSNIWVDFDNDGDLDCFVTRDGARTSLYYTNNGNGTFAKIDSVPMSKTAVAHIAAVAGDYDNDGDMDLFMIAGASANELYRNEQSSSNNWLNVTVNGYPLNRSAIGAKVKVKATINGNTYWQIREISAQNSFNGHNSHTAHFGLGNASVIDSLVIEWLSGSKKIMINVPAKQHLTITENSTPVYLRSVFYGDNLTDQIPMTVNFTDLSFGDSTTMPNSWKWDFNNDGVIDATTKNGSFTYTAVDTYSVKLIVSNGIKSDTLVRHRYVVSTPALPIISFNINTQNFGPIDVNTEKKDTTLYIYNYGKGNDSIYVSLVYGVTTTGTVKPDSALSISPKAFMLASKDSQAIVYTFYPRRVIRTNLTITYTPKIVITSKNNSGTKIFEKNMYFKLSGTLTDIATSAPVPSVYALQQNYPNPFNPSTVIHYQLPYSGFVSFKLYDAIGREVAQLVNTTQEAGQYSITVRTQEFSLSSGIYYYRLTAGDFVDCKKFVVLK